MSLSKKFQPLSPQPRSRSDHAKAMGLSGVTIPGWVRWIAQDADGAWWGFEHEPNEGALGWYENEAGRYVRLGKGAPNPRWTDALFRAERLIRRSVS